MLIQFQPNQLLQMVGQFEVLFWFLEAVSLKEGKELVATSLTLSCIVGMMPLVG